MVVLGLSQRVMLYNVPIIYCCINFVYIYFVYIFYCQAQNLLQSLRHLDSYLSEFSKILSYFDLKCYIIRACATKQIQFSPSLCQLKCVVI